MSMTAQEIITHYKAAKAQIITVESCTGGLIGAALTAVSGSSSVVDGGLITYSNEAKEKLAGVPAQVLHAHGAVSEQTAQAMAEGGLRGAALASVSIAVTGIAGPTGGSAEKPVGLVYIASARTGHETLVQKHHFQGGRDAVRAQTVEAALTLLALRLTV